LPGGGARNCKRYTFYQRNEIDCVSTIERAGKNQFRKLNLTKALGEIPQ